MDTEGINDPKQDQNWTTKLFILCLTISSTFIYNINGIIGSNNIGKLHLMTDLNKFIQEPEDYGFLPRLVIYYVILLWNVQKFYRIFLGNQSQK